MEGRDSVAPEGGCDDANILCGARHQGGQSLRGGAVSESLRARLLERLTSLSAPVADLQRQLAELGWDCDKPLVSLSRADVADVLRRYIGGAVTDAQLEEWADAIEVREDVDFESGHEEVLKEFIFWLANPLLTASPTIEEARAWLRRLQQRATTGSAPGIPTRSRLEVPHLTDLDEDRVDVVSHEAGVASVTAQARDGDLVTLTWDELACSVHVRWMSGSHERLTLERETASKVSVRVDHDQVQFHVWSEANDLRGKLVVRIGGLVEVIDALLEG